MPLYHARALYQFNLEFVTVMNQKATYIYPGCRFDVCETVALLLPTPRASQNSVALSWASKCIPEAKPITKHQLSLLTAKGPKP